MSNQQNDNLNTLGFITAELRRNLVVGFITILLIAWFFDHNRLQADKLDLANKINDLEVRIDEITEKHIKSLQDEIQKRDELLNRVKKNEAENNKMEKEIKRIN